MTRGNAEAGNEQGWPTTLLSTIGGSRIRLGRGPAPLSRKAHGLLLASLLGALAGMVDAIGFLSLGHLFVSYMSGNSTQFAVALGRADFVEARSIIELILLFVLGAAVGQLLARCAGRRHLTAVLGMVAVLLALAAALAAVIPMVLAMGILNAAMHRAGNLGVSLTFVTGTLVRLGQGLGDFLVRRASGWDWLAQAIPWVGLTAGAVTAAVAYARIDGAATWLAVCAAMLLTVWSIFIPEPD